VPLELVLKILTRLNLSLWFIKTKNSADGSLLSFIDENPIKINPYLRKQVKNRNSKLKIKEKK
jgi:hypothetical protein